MEIQMAPKKIARHRSPNGSLRPYKDGDRWIAPRRVALPNGKTALIRGTGRTRVEAEARLRANVDKRVQVTPPSSGRGLRPGHRRGLDPALARQRQTTRHP